MPHPAQEHAEQVINTFNELIGKSLVAFEAGWAETATAAKLLAAAAETEGEEARKVGERVASYASSRNATVASALEDLLENTTQPAAKELLEKLFDQDRSCYQAWTDYVVEFQARRAALFKGLIEANAGMVELSQNLAQSAASYGEAVQAWSKQVVDDSTPKSST